jgi:ABC-type transport system involved in multi-copper enzyme maturation permease subunit
MKWLLWKDYRHNRFIIFTGLFLLLAPYLLALYLTLGGPWPGLDERHLPIWQWRNNISAASVVSLFLGQVIFAVIGGNAIAGERTDRTSEFLFSLPIARRRLLTGKLLLALLIVAVVWTNVAIIGSLQKESLQPRDWPGILEVGANLATTSLVFFCVAWMLSSFTPSPVLSVCGGLIAPALVWGGLWSVLYFQYLSTPTVVYERQLFFLAESWYRTICLTIAPVSFLAGTWYYLRRVEP